MAPAKGKAKASKKHSAATAEIGEPATPTNDEINVSSELKSRSSNKEINIGPLNVKIEELTVRRSEWTLEEDMFIIRHLEILQTPAKKLETLYKALSKKQVDSYNKKDPPIHMFQQRMEELQMPECKARLTLLTRLVQSAVAAEEEAATLAAEEAQRKKEEDEAAADKKNKKNKEVQEADAVEEEEEEIEIKVIDGTKRERTMLTMKRPLKNMSPVLRQQIVNLPPAKFVDAPQTLVFDARGMLYDRVINWDVIQMPVIEKMCKMLQNPDCVEKKYSLLEKIQTLDEAIEEQKKSALADLDAKRTAWTEIARDKTLRDIELVKEANEASFKDYVKEIRKAFDERLQMTVHGLQAQSAALQDEIQLYFAEQEERMRGMVEEYKQQEAREMRRKLSESQALANEIYSKDYVMKLAILGKLLEVDCMQEAAMMILKRDPNDFVQCKEWECDSIRDKYSREVLPTMSVWDILKLEEMHPPKSYMSRDHIEREVSARRKVMWEELCALPNEELAAYVDSETPPWPDLVEKAVSDRRSKRGYGSLNTALLTPHIKLTNHGATAESCHPLRYSTVHGLVEKASEGWGRHYFEVTIDELTKDGSTICVGFDPVRESNDDAPIPGLAPSAPSDDHPNGMYGASVQSDGFVHFEGKSEFHGVLFEKGCTIGVGLDVVQGYACFSVNGARIMNLVPGPNPKECWKVPISRPFTLVAAASLFTVRDKSQARLSFNFTGPFEHLEAIKSEGWDAVADER